MNDPVNALIKEIEEQLEAVTADMPDAEPGYEYELIATMLAAADAPDDVKREVRRCLL